MQKDAEIVERLWTLLRTAEGKGQTHPESAPHYISLPLQGLSGAEPGIVDALSFNRTGSQELTMH